MDEPKKKRPFHFTWTEWLVMLVLIAVLTSIITVFGTVH